jgi:hypothetical protein
MGELIIHGRRIGTVFELLGTQENDMTRALGWTFSECPTFLRAFIRTNVPRKYHSSKIQLELQRWQKTKGYTDIELSSIAKFHVIVEAKRGWQHPNSVQLRKYAARIRRTGVGFKCLVMLTDWSYAGITALTQQVLGVPVRWLSWSDVAQIASDAKRRTSGVNERRWIDELLRYLTGVATMQEVDSNWVFTVSLGNKTPKNWKVSWVDIVERKKRYFHSSQGGGWPKTPPNYLAWRYNGQLQGIAHVTKYKIVPDMHSEIPEIPKGEIRNCVLYNLGPMFRPDHVVRTGNVYPSGHSRCMLDTLFTSRTIAEAAKISREREKNAKQYTY